MPVVCAHPTGAPGDALAHRNPPTHPGRLWRSRKTGARFMHCQYVGGRGRAGGRASTNVCACLFVCVEPGLVEVLETVQNPHGSPPASSSPQQHRHCHHRTHARSTRRRLASGSRALHSRRSLALWWHYYYAAGQQNPGCCLRRVRDAPRTRQTGRARGGTAACCPARGRCGRRIRASRSASAEPFRALEGRGTGTLGNRGSRTHLLRERGATRVPAARP